MRVDSELSFYDTWRELQNDTDGWNWYWLSYGEKCYGWAVVTAFPLDEDGVSPPAGTRLEPHFSKPNVWVAEDGTEMLIDECLAENEDQRGGAVVRFISQAFAYAADKWGAGG